MISVYAVGFLGMQDLVVWPERVIQHFIVDKIRDDRQLTKSNKIRVKLIFIVSDRINGVL